jgi:CRP/FNR family transcriptional regulator, anaerobic regulatory protein
VLVRYVICPFNNKLLICCWLNGASKKILFFRHSQLVPKAFGRESQRLDGEIPTFVGMTLNRDNLEFFLTRNSLFKKYITNLKPRMKQSAYDSMFDLLNSIYPLSDTLKQAFFDSTQEVSLKKGAILFKTGEVASNAYFVNKGMARTYYYKDDKEITSNICPENRIFIAASSYYTGQPSYEMGELIEDSSLIILSHDTIERLCLEFLELNYMIRKLVETFYVVLEQRTYFLHMKNAQEKYNFLIQNNPDYFLRVPLGQIASFLSMTQETLSRLRSRVYHKV